MKLYYFADTHTHENPIKIGPGLYMNTHQQAILRGRQLILLYNTIALIFKWNSEYHKCPKL